MIFANTLLFAVTYALAHVNINVPLVERFVDTVLILPTGECKVTPDVKLLPINQRYPLLFTTD